MSIYISVTDTLLWCETPCCHIETLQEKDSIETLQEHDCIRQSTRDRNYQHDNTHEFLKEVAKLEDWP